MKLRETVFRENVKFFFAHVTNSYHPHERRYELDARTRGDVRTEDENFRTHQCREGFLNLGAG